MPSTWLNQFNSKAYTHQKNTHSTSRKANMSQYYRKIKEKKKMRMKNKMKWGKITVFHIFLGPIFLYFCTQNAAQYNCTMHSHSAHSYYEHTIAYSYRCVFTVGKQASQRSQIVWCVWFIRRHLLWCMQYACTRAFMCVRHMTGECAEKYISLFRLLISVCGAAWRRRRREIRSTIQSAQRQHGARHIFFWTNQRMKNAKCVNIFGCSTVRASLAIHIHIWCI